MFSIQELRSSTAKELDQELSKARKDFLKVRISVRSKHEKDTSKVKKLNRYIAQILTVMGETKEEAPAKATAPKEVSAKVAEDKAPEEKADKKKKSKKTS